MKNKEIEKWELNYDLIPRIKKLYSPGYTDEKEEESTPKITNRE